MVNKFIYQQLSQHKTSTTYILAICILAICILAIGVLAIGVLAIGAVLTFLKVWPLGPPSS